MNDVFILVLIIIILALPFYLIFRFIRGRRIKNELKKASQPKPTYKKYRKLAATLIAILILLTVKVLTGNSIVAIWLGVISEVILLKILKNK